MLEAARLRRRLLLCLGAPLALSACTKKGPPQQADSGDPEPVARSADESPVADETTGAIERSLTTGAAQQAEEAPPPDPVRPCDGRRGLTKMSMERAREIAEAGSESIEGCPSELQRPENAPRTFVLSEQPTRRLHEAGEEDQCCYRSPFPHRGRPLLDGGDVVVARTVVDRAPESPMLGSSFGGAASVAAGWMRDAEQEYASVAAFARAAIELMAVGAPPDLIAGCHEAALDELEHARICLELAVRRGATPQGFEPLPALPPREADALRLARDTYLEGCEAETAASLVASRAAAACRDSVVREALHRIADDEANHASLAFRTLAWLLQRMSLGQRAEFIAWARARVAAMTPWARVTPTDPDGRPTEHEQAAITNEAVREVVGPVLERLVGQAA